MKFCRRQQSQLSLSFSISVFAHSSLSLSQTFSIQPCLSLVTLSPLSLSLPSVYTLFPPRFFFVSQLFQLLSLSLYLSLQMDLNAKHCLLSASGGISSLERSESVCSSAESFLLLNLNASLTYFNLDQNNIKVIRNIILSSNVVY